MAKRRRRSTVQAVSAQTLIRIMRHLNAIHDIQDGVLQALTSLDDRMARLEMALRGADIHVPLPHVDHTPSDFDVPPPLVPDFAEGIV